MTNLVTKNYIRPGCALYTAWEPDSGHIGSDKIYGGGQTWRPLGNRVIHTVDESILLRQEVIDIISDAFPETITQRKIIGMSYVIAYEFSEEDTPAHA